MITPLPQFDEPEPEPTPAAGVAGIPGKLVADLKVLRPQFLLPCREIASTGWLRDFKWISVFLLGLFPLAVLALMQAEVPIALTCLALYFSALWMLFFHHFFSLGEGSWKTALICFVSTVVIVQIAISLGLEHWRDSFVYSSNVAVELFGEVCFVAIPGYLCRLAVIFFLLRPGASSPSLPAMVYYGLCSGLAMGMTEALNWELSNVGADGALFFFYWNAVLRLTTFAFMPAIWTGLATYFFTLAKLYPTRRLGLWTVAVVLPLLLETIHYAFPAGLGWLQLAVDFCATFILMSYLFRRSEFQNVLAKA